MPGFIPVTEYYKNWKTRWENGKKFKVLDPIEMMLEFFKLTEELDEWEAKTAFIVGPKNSGKTVILRYFKWLVGNNPDYIGLTSSYRTNDLRIVKDKRYAHLFKKKNVILQFIDDAMMAGMDARRAMSGENVDMTKEFEVVRHTLEENYEPRGIIFTIFASQIYTRIDPTIRSNAQLKIFTVYYDEDWFKKLFTPEDVEFMRLKTHEGMFASKLKERRYALAKTNAGYVATIDIPFLSKDFITYPNIIRKIDKNHVRNLLARILIQKVHVPPRKLGHYNKSELKEFLQMHSKPIEKKFRIDLKDPDFMSAINRANFIIKTHERQQLNADIDSYMYFDPNEELTYKEKILNALKQEKIATIETISLITRIENIATIRNILSDHKDLFENARPGTGVWCLKNYNYSDHQINNLLGKKPMKMLKMSDSKA